MDGLVNNCIDSKLYCFILCTGPGEHARESKLTVQGQKQVCPGESEKAQLSHKVCPWSVCSLSGRTLLLSKL